SFPIVAQICINGLVVTSACSPNDGPGIVHVVAGSIGPQSANQTLFTIHYTIGSGATSTPTTIGYATGCSNTSAPDGTTCFTVVSASTSTSIPAIGTTGTFSTPPPSFDYSLSNNGPVTITRGSSGTVTITAKLISGTAPSVTLSCVSSTLPVGVSCTSFNPASVTPTTAGAASTLTISVSSTAIAGSFTFQVTGSPLGATTAPTSIGLTIAVPFDYVLSNNGPVSITAGSSGTVTITAKLTGGAAQSVALSCVTPLPSGITCTSFSPASVTPTSAGATSILTISVASSVAAGSYSVMVTGSPLGATTTATTVAVSVTAGPSVTGLSSMAPVAITADS